MKRSKFLFISFQEKFEDIDNLKYFKELETKFSNKYEIKIIKNKFYKGNIFFKQNHYFFIAKITNSGMYAFPINDQGMLNPIELDFVDPIKYYNERTP